VPFFRGWELGPHPTKWHPDPSSRFLQYTWAENWGLCPFLEGVELGLHPTQRRLAKAYLRIKWHLDSSSHFTTTDMGRKLGAVLLFGELGPHQTQCGMGQGLLSYQVAP